MIRKTEATPSFKAYYTPQKMKQIEEFIRANRHLNPNFTDYDIVRIKDSVASFNAFYNGTKTLSPEKISNELYRKFNIPSDFQGDKIVAGCTALAANIFHYLGLAQPKGVYKAQLGKGIMGDCNAVTRIVRLNSDVNWNEVQTEAIEAKISNHSSSGHFLKTFIHEFMHNYQSKKLMELDNGFVYNNVTMDSFINRIKNSPAFKAIMQNRVLSTKSVIENGQPIKDGAARTYVQQKLSTYGATAPAEMYSEVCTKMITNVLDKRSLRPKYNPFNNKDMLQDKFLMKLMDDFYNGHFEGYI